MKKIILGIFVMFLFAGSVSFGQTTTTKTVETDVNVACAQYKDNPNRSYINLDINGKCCLDDITKKVDGLTGCDATKLQGQEGAAAIAASADQTINGMTIGKTCLLNGQCKFSFYKFLGIRQSVEGEGKDPTSPELFIQDIILAATTFIGTLLAISLIISGLMYIFAGASGKEPTKAKSGIINSIIGLVIVLGAYAIIRLVQYIAKGF